MDTKVVLQYAVESNSDCGLSTVQTADPTRRSCVVNPLHFRSRFCTTNPKLTEAENTFKRSPKYCQDKTIINRANMFANAMPANVLNLNPHYNGSRLQKLAFGTVTATCVLQFWPVQKVMSINYRLKICL